jgi:hypothetical protein
VQAASLSDMALNGELGPVPAVQVHGRRGCGCQRRARAKEAPPALWLREHRRRSQERRAVEVQAHVELRSLEKEAESKAGQEDEAGLCSAVSASWASPRLAPGGALVAAGGGDNLPLSWTTRFPQLPQPPPPGPPAGGAFPGEAEMLFRVHNTSRSVARFEDYRAADGNEMMRFSPAPPYGPASAADGGDGVDTARVWTFDGSGGAHASARGPATGRRAMLLCMVIAGRVAEAGTGSDSSLPGKEHDSLRVGKGELVVLDRRAVLPCFLIIYKL